jgi:hypothetical protein
VVSSEYYQFIRRAEDFLQLFLCKLPFFMSNLHIRLKSAVIYFLGQISGLLMTTWIDDVTTDAEEFWTEKTNPVL